MLPKRTWDKCKKNFTRLYSSSKKIEMLLRLFLLHKHSQATNTNQLFRYRYQSTTAMASIKVSQAIAALVAETKLSVVDKLIAFLGEKIEIDEDMTQYFEEFKNTLKEESKEATKKAGKKEPKAKEEKTKRAPSAYNLYIRDKMAEFKAAGHTGNLMKMAIEAWNEDKGKKTEEEIVEAKVNTPEEVKKTSPLRPGFGGAKARTKKNNEKKDKETKDKETKDNEKKEKKKGGKKTKKDEPAASDAEKETTSDKEDNSNSKDSDNSDYE